jgi:hypothetical protein
VVIPRPASLLRHDVLPLVLGFIALVVATLLTDALLHGLDLVWVGRYLGIPGVLLIIGSFGYSLRKRKLIAVGKPGPLLRLHERMAWAGSWLVLVHAGIHFNALLAWLAVAAMLVNVASGLTGKFLLGRLRRRLDETRLQLRAQGLDEVAIEERLAWDSLTVDAVRQWKVVHLPIALALAVLGIAHIASVFLFWGWR